MKSVLRFCATLLIALPGARPACAGGEFLELGPAAARARRADEPLFALVVSEGPLRSDVGLPRLRSLADTDADAGSFVLAVVNLYEPYRPTPEEVRRGQRAYRRNPRLALLYGGVGACHVIAPGASRPLWTADKGADQADVFARAREAYAGWREPLDAALRRLQDDPEARRDPEARIQVAEGWARGHAVKQATEAFDAAARLASAGPEGAGRVEAWGHGAGRAALDGWDYGEARRRFAALLERHPASPRRAEALVGLAEAHLGAGDAKPALKALAELPADCPEPVRQAADEVRRRASQARAGP